MLERIEIRRDPVLYRQLHAVIARIVFATILSAMSAAAWSEEDAIHFSVAIRGAVAMEKLPYEGALVFDVGGEEIYISSCGFANITYRTGPISPAYEDHYEEEGRTQSFRYLMGEFCEVADALLEKGFLSVIAYYEREGVQYLTGNGAMVYADQDGALYVADADFLEANELQALARPIVNGERDEGCVVPDVNSPSEGRVRVEGQFCFTTGVYLSDIAEHERKTNGNQ